MVRVFAAAAAALFLASGDRLAWHETAAPTSPDSGSQKVRVHQQLPRQQLA